MLHRRHRQIRFFHDRVSMDDGISTAVDFKGIRTDVVCTVSNDEQSAFGLQGIELTNGHAVVLVGDYAVACGK